MSDTVGYNEWYNREVKYPDLTENTWVRLLPQELGGGTLKGKVNWKIENRKYAIVIPYGGNGALIYVHGADIEPCEEHEPESKFPIDTIANGLMSQFDFETLVTASSQQLDDIIKLYWPTYRSIGYDGQRTVLNAVSRLIHFGTNKKE